MIVQNFCHRYFKTVTIVLPNTYFVIFQSFASKIVLSVKYLMIFNRYRILHQIRYIV